MAGRLWPWFLLLLALLTTLLIRIPSVTVGPTAAAQFTLAVLRDPDTLDPALARRPEDLAIVQNVFDTLLRESRTGALIPALASRVSVAGRTITVQLRRARLVNGTPVTASLVAESLARPLGHTVRSPVAEALLAPVVGSSSVISGKTAELAGVRVLSRRTLTITVARRAAARGLVVALANPALAIVPVDDALHGGANWQFVGLYGSGGWQLTDWDPGDLLVFRRVFGGGPSGVDVVEYPSLREAELSVVNGAADAVELNAEALASLPRRWLRLVRPVRLAGTLRLAYRPAGTGRPGSPVPLSVWVREAFRGKAPVVAGRLPGNLPGRLVIAVNPHDPEAMALADRLRRLRPGVAVVPAAPAAMAGLAAGGRVNAALTSRAVAGLAAHVSIVPRLTWWMMPTGLRARFFADGQIMWHTVGWRS